MVLVQPSARSLLFTREGIRSVDAAAAAELGIPGIVLMENAAVALREAALALMSRLSLRESLICCGPGNNGGDGLALARHLHNRGVPVRILLGAAQKRYTGDALLNLHVVRRMGLPLTPLDMNAPQAALSTLDAAIDARTTLIVDALFGTGLDKPVKPPFDAMIAWINQHCDRGATVLAVDIPSGLDCDTGQPLGESCIRADATVTLGGLKVGLVRPEAMPFVGELSVGDIGVPPELLRRFAIS